ncbi:hypothetical protein M378DRAFT_168746 [Amanita muscaria Koide BX008]|uniref:Uncharacterized protein n=1 Tax=Amanita muscaria (strain Koide BX008) TaxID=946122 RepID=A0A0C2WU46_AMAMK|nr:hypothetical protein M378DRAFT_168746 [Amanita muscaria Koide BX008]
MVDRFIVSPCGCEPSRLAPTLNVHFAHYDWGKAKERYSWNSENSSQRGSSPTGAKSSYVSVGTLTAPTNQLTALSLKLERLLA